MDNFNKTYLSILNEQKETQNETDTDSSTSERKPRSGKFSKVQEGMTITDRKGRTTTIEPNKRYAVLYFVKGYNEMRVDQGAYLNYRNDGYIGHDDCEGNARGPRFAFDGKKGDVFSLVPKEHIYGIMPVDEYNEKIKSLFD